MNKKDGKKNNEGEKSDKDIIDEIFSGNVNAFETIVKKYEKMIYNLAMSKTQHRETAQDITQDCFIRAYKMLHSYRTDSAFSTWIYKICQNLIIDYYRKNKNLKTLSLTSGGNDAGNIPQLGSGEKETEVADSSSEPLSLVIRQEKIDKIRELINSLPEDLKEILILRDFNDFNYKQIAEMLDIEIGTVKSRLNRAREKLKTLVKESADFMELL